MRRFVVAVSTAVLALAATAVAATGAGAAPITTQLAGGGITLDCGGYDQRTATDRLPRPGVVVMEQWTYPNGAVAWTDYNPYTVSNDGSIEQIYVDKDSQAGIVAVWENGTNCYGSEISRNAWAVAPNGRVYTGNGFSGPPANHYGDASNLPLNQPIVGMSPTSTGRGYWLVASDGGIFTYGDARFFGSTGDLVLNKPIVGMSVTPTGNGYWLVATDGGIFSFGDAKFFGSTGNLVLNKPISGMTTTPTGRGYWMVASDGGIFTFGDAAFKGSTGAMNLPSPIAGMIPWGTGYMLIGQDLSTYPFR